MLVLTRKRGQAIVIDGGRVRVTILEARGGLVRLGIEAPRDVRVDRAELHDKFQGRRDGKRGS
jgi:carbon storage regulator